MQLEMWKLRYIDLKLLEIKNWKAAQYELTSPILNMEQYIPPIAYMRTVQ